MLAALLVQLGERGQRFAVVVVDLRDADERLDRAVEIGQLVAVDAADLQVQLGLLHALAGDVDVALVGADQIRPAPQVTVQPLEAGQRVDVGRDRGSAPGRGARRPCRA